MELRWAWRNVRARGWRAGLTVALLAVALAANVLVFSVADSIVFHRLPYRDAERLIEIQQRDSSRADLSPALLEEWRKQTDLFAGVHGYLSKTLFLAGNGEPEMVPTADVTVGLIELLGARARWGRSFVGGDDRQMDLQPVLIAESLARARFGDPATAIGRQLATSGEPLVVIGVMPGEFRFPDAERRIWRALDPRGPLARNFAGVRSIARIAPGVTRALVAQRMEQRSGDIGLAAGIGGEYSAQPGAVAGATTDAERRRLLFVLVGAALCLLLIACANVASLELSSALQRARTYAIQLAVGASRAALARTAVIEGGYLIGGATVAALALARAGAHALGLLLPARLTRSSANPVDLDERALIYMAGIAAVAWLLSSMPVVLYAVKANLLEVLKVEGPSVAASGGGVVRRALTVVEVALTVMLLVGSVVYVRSYRALLALDKGFDSSGVVTIHMAIPPQSYSSSAEKAVLGKDATSRVRMRPGVLAAVEAAAPPSMGARHRVAELVIDDRPALEEKVTISELNVEADYFRVLGIPLRSGRLFEAVEPPTHVIVGETFARHYWLGGHAVGRQFRYCSTCPSYQVIGIAGHVRSPYDPPGRRSTRDFQIYLPRQPAPPPSPVTPGQPATGGSYGFVTLMARVDSRSRAAELYKTVRAIDSRFILKLEFVDDVYAQHFDDRLLATRVIGTFGALAFVIAAAGIYGVMAFLVANRRQEIGIRMALGADKHRIQRLVLGSSLRLVMLGAALGIIGTLAASRWVQSQMFGVSATDPPTVGLVALGVIATALLATWQPARQAARVDPNALLKS